MRLRRIVVLALLWTVVQGFPSPVAPPAVAPRPALAEGDAPAPAAPSDGSPDLSTLLRRAPGSPAVASVVGSRPRLSTTLTIDSLMTRSDFSAEMARDFARALPVAPAGNSAAPASLPTDTDASSLPIPEETAEAADTPTPSLSAAAVEPPGLPPDGGAPPASPSSEGTGVAVEPALRPAESATGGGSPPSLRLRPAPETAPAPVIAGDLPSQSAPALAPSEANRDVRIEAVPIEAAPPGMPDRFAAGAATVAADSAVSIPLGEAAAGAPDQFKIGAGKNQTTLSDSIRSVPLDAAPAGTGDKYTLGIGTSGASTISDPLRSVPLDVAPAGSQVETFVLGRGQLKISQGVQPIPLDQAPTAAFQDHFSLGPGRPTLANPTAPIPHVVGEKMSVPTVVAAAGNARNTIGVVGRGFDPGERIVLWLDVANATLARTIGAAAAEADGAYTTAPVALPAGTLAGEHTLDAVGQTSGKVATTLIYLEVAGHGVPAPEASGSTPAPPAPAPTSSEPALWERYVVRRGDTLSAIARRWGTTVEALMACNGIWSPGMIYEDQVLIIPRAARH